MTTKKRRYNMVNRPSSFETGEKQCLKCGEWRLIEFFSKSGKSISGTPQYRAYCKECRGKSPEGYSNCTNCPKLEECSELVDTLEDLPCQNGFTPPRSAKWPFEELLIENGVIRV